MYNFYELLSCLERKSWGIKTLWRSKFRGILVVLKLQFKLSNFFYIEDYWFEKWANQKISARTRWTKCVRYQAKRGADEALAKAEGGEKRATKKTWKQTTWRTDGARRKTFGGENETWDKPSEPIVEESNRSRELRQITWNQ